MSWSEIPPLVLLTALIFAGCSQEPAQEARPPDDTQQRTAAETGQTTVPEPTKNESTRRGDSPEYIVIGESEREEAGVRMTQVIVTAKKTSEPELRRIVEDLKSKYRDSDAVSVEIMDGSAGFGRAGSAVIMYTDEGARLSGYPEGIPNDQGYVLDTVD